MKNENRLRLLAWLSDIDVSVHYNSVRNKRQPGTGDWLLKSKELEDWKHLPNSLVWLSGKGVLLSDNRPCY